VEEIAKIFRLEKISLTAPKLEFDFEATIVYPILWYLVTYFMWIYKMFVLYKNEKV
jgi:hypothetical protein